MATENVDSVEDKAVTLQAGLRTLHEKGPELKRAISGQLDEMLEQVRQLVGVQNNKNIYKFLVNLILN